MSTPKIDASKMAFLALSKKFSGKNTQPSVATPLKPKPMGFSEYLTKTDMDDARGITRKQPETDSNLENLSKTKKFHASGNDIPFGDVTGTGLVADDVISGDRPSTLEKVLRDPEEYIVEDIPEEEACGQSNDFLQSLDVNSILDLTKKAVEELCPVGKVKEGIINIPVASGEEEEDEGEEIEQVDEEGDEKQEKLESESSESFKDIWERVNAACNEISEEEFAMAEKRSRRWLVDPSKDPKLMTLPEQYKIYNAERKEKLSRKKALALKESTENV